MYKKIIEMCSALNIFSTKELRDNGIEALLIYGVGKHDNNIVATEFIRGDVPEALAMIGAALSNISSKSGIPLFDLLNMIYENESKLKEEGE